jgi:hypothetical protein
MWLKAIGSFTRRILICPRSPSTLFPCRKEASPRGGLSLIHPHLQSKGEGRYISGDQASFGALIFSVGGAREESAMETLREELGPSILYLFWWISVTLSKARAEVWCF